ncbi:PH domain-containing protein [Aliidiomarina sanyensis]|nr:PH domain-containing protein [Aliidiomarina sanyensis]
MYTHAVALGSAAVCLVAFALAVRTGSALAIILTLSAAIFGAGLPLWLLASTNYTLSDSKLFVKCGPFKRDIPIAQITSIKATSSPLSSAALSTDRLQIDYGRGQSIMISPKDKEEFLRDLETRRAIGAHNTNI